MFGQIRCIWAKLVVFRRIGCNRANSLYLGNIVVFGTVVVFVRKWLSSANLVVFGQNWFCLGI